MNYIKKYINKLRNASAPVKAGFWFTICSIINKCIQLITVPIFTRLLTPTEYGEYSVFISWQSILLIIATLNIHSNVFNNGLLKYENKKEDFLSSMQGLTTFITIILMIFALLFKNFCVNLIGLPIELIMLLLLEILLTPGYELWAAKQRYDFKYKKVVLSTLLLLLLNPVIGLILVFNSSQKGYARILSVLIVQIFIYGVLYLNNLKNSKKIFDKDYWKYALILAIPLIPHYLSQTLLNQMDRIMISNIIGVDKSGIYSVAYSGAMLLLIVGKSIQSSFTPWIYKKMKAKQQNDIKPAVNYLIILVGILNFILICFAPEIIYLLAGNKYYEAIYIIPPVAISSYLIFLYSMFCTLEFYFEQSKQMMVVSVCGAFINFLTNEIFIRYYGYYAAGYTTLFCYLIFTVSHYFIMKHALVKNNEIMIYDIKFIIIFTLFFIIFAFMMLFLYSNIILRYIIIVCILFFIMINYKKITSKIVGLRKE